MHIFNVYIWWVWIYTCIHDTITTIKVINISINSKSFLAFLMVIFVVITLNMKSILLTYFKVHNTRVNLGTMLYSKSPFFTLHNWNFIPIEQRLPFSSPLSAPGNHRSMFYFYEFDYFRCLIYSVCPSVTDLFYLVQCPLISSMLSQKKGFPSF